MLVMPYIRLTSQLMNKHASNHHHTTLNGSRHIIQLFQKMLIKDRSDLKALMGFKVPNHPAVSGMYF